MYLNIGNKLLTKENIIGIFDFDNTTTSKNTQKYLQMLEKKGKLIFLTEDLPKSFIIYKNENENHVYVSEFASKTLQKRMEVI